MTAEPEIIGPTCQLCESELAVGSLMNLADYETVRFGADCGPAYLRGIATAIDGADSGPEPAEAAPDPDPEPLAAGHDELHECQLCHAMVPAAAVPDHVQDHIASGDIPDPEAAAAPDSGSFPGTANVVRSTHGHRRGRTAADSPPEAGS